MSKREKVMRKVIIPITIISCIAHAVQGRGRITSNMQRFFAGLLADKFSGMCSFEKNWARYFVDVPGDDCWWKMYWEFRPNGYLKLFELHDGEGNLVVRNSYDMAGRLKTHCKLIYSAMESDFTRFPRPMCREYYKFAAEGVCELMMCRNIAGDIVEHKDFIQLS
ncbi:MAG: hypothetical protein WC471_03805 [Candidatus Woesearchaeota archaeon]